MGTERAYAEIKKGIYVTACTRLKSKINGDSRAYVYARDGRYRHAGHTDPAYDGTKMMNACTDTSAM